MFQGDHMEEKKEKSLFQQVIDGDIEPEGAQKGWINLKKGQNEHNFAVIDPEKAKEIRRKGAEAINKLHGKKKTAREALEGILTLKVTDEIIAGADLPEDIAERLKRSNPDITIYDLIQLVAAGRAVGGNIKAAEYIRDTYGDAPIKEYKIDGSITTEQDRQLMQQIAGRLEAAGEIFIVKDQEAETDQDQQKQGSDQLFAKGNLCE